MVKVCSFYNAMTQGSHNKMNSSGSVKHVPVLLLACLGVHAAQGQDLQQKLRDIAADARGRVAIACSLPGTALRCDLDANAKAPMQSVFKLPLALTVLHRVEQGFLSLDDSIRFLPGDRILPQTYSPLQDAHPQANVDVPVRDLLRMTVALSDNVAADLLLRTAGGPGEVARYIASLGIVGFQLKDGERALHHDSRLQYRNWMTPAAAVKLLRLISDHPPLSPDHANLLLGWMRDSVKPRLKSDLPADAVVFHKAGTSGVDGGLAHATNDIGLIQLPDGRRVAVAVFLTDCRADADTRDRVIARIGKVIYDAAIAATAGSGGQAKTAAHALEKFTRQMLEEANARGFVHVREVQSGSVLVHVSTADASGGAGIQPAQFTVDAPVAPLSVIKVYLAAIWLEHGFGETAVHCAASARYPIRRMMGEDMLMSGCDSAGEEMAVVLRNKVGPGQVWRDLRHALCRKRTWSGSSAIQFATCSVRQPASARLIP